MTTNRPRRLNRRAADQMLDAPGTPAGDSVSEILAAAAAPSTGELHGEAAALAQFRAHVAAVPPTTPEGAPLMVTTRRKLAVPAVALAAAGVLAATGGVALAASNGALHVPFTGHDNRSDKAPTAPESTNPGLGASGKPSATTTDGATPKAHPTADPSPSLRGLCVAFQAGSPKDGKTNPAFTALTKAAGGADNVTTYCVALLGTPKAHPTHPAKPTQPVKPTHPAKPTQAASPTKPTHPTKPAKPTQAASPTQGPKAPKATPTP